MTNPTVQVAPAAASTVANPYASLLGITTVPAPRKRGLKAYYMHKHYATRVKPEFLRRWSTACSAWTESNAEDRARSNMVQPHEVALRAKVTQEFLDAESPAFKAALEVENQSDYELRALDWKRQMQVSTTPQEFH